MNQKRWLPLAICVLFTFVAVAAAEESGWSLSKLNPFAKKTTTTSRTSNAKRTEHGLKLSNKKPAEPSLWTKMTNGTKEAFAKTKDALTPGSSKTSKPASSRTAASRPAAKTSESKSTFASWFGKDKEEPKKPRTPSEFLSQERP